MPAVTLATELEVVEIVTVPSVAVSATPPRGRPLPSTTLPEIDPAPGTSSTSSSTRSPLSGGDTTNDCVV